MERQNSEMSYYADDEDGKQKKYTRRGKLNFSSFVSKFAFHCDLVKYIYIYINGFSLETNSSASVLFCITKFKYIRNLSNDLVVRLLLVLFHLMRSHYCESLEGHLCGKILKGSRLNVFVLLYRYGQLLFVFG